jgi:hypothetical protein
MSTSRTTHEALIQDAVQSLVGALEQVDIEVVSFGSEGHSELPQWGKFDAFVEVLVDDRPLVLAVEAKAYATTAAVERLTIADRPPEGRLPILVADRINRGAEQILSKAGWSWFDRRGELHLRAPGIRVDTSVPAAERTRTARTRPISGRSGITVAYWLCVHRGESLSPTKGNDDLRLAPSSISTAMRRMADAGLVDERGAGVAPELFWELASTWSVERTWLIERPQPQDHARTDHMAPSWRVTGTEAAAAYGAPIAFSGFGPLDLYVTGPVEITIAVRRYGMARPGTGTASVAVPPTSLVTDAPKKDVLPLVEDWPAAPLVAVALDLAQDPGRGREILLDWKEGDGIWR